MATDLDNIVERLERVVTWHRGTQKVFVQEIIADLTGTPVPPAQPVTSGSAVPPVPPAPPVPPSPGEGIGAATAPQPPPG